MRAIARTRGASALILFSFLFASGPAFAVAFPDGEEEEAKEEAEDEADEADEEEQEEWYAIVGGDVYAGDGSILRGATVLAKNGVIKEIGYDLYLPEDTEKLDARGLRVYPGLVALSATTRISKGLFSTAPERSVEVDEDGEPKNFDELHPDHSTRVPAEPTTGFPGHIELGEEDVEFATKRSDIEESFDPFSQYMVLALATGITCAEQSDAAIKLRRGEIDDILLRERYAVSVSWSVRNPSSIRTAKEKFAAAAEYLRKYREWEERGDKEEKEPSKKGVDANTLRILRGERLASFNAHNREDLLGIARLAQRYNFRPVIYGCREGWTVADELGRAGAFAVITPRDTRPKEEQLVRAGGSSIENAAKLHAAGVQVAVIPGNTSMELSGMTGRDLLHLPVEAGFAVRGGLSNEAALEAITLIPARILGVDHRVGTLEPGKDLDAIVTDGDVLHYQTFVQYAVVGGKLCYDKEEELFYAHIRPRTELPALDPGEAPPAEDEASVEEPEEEPEDGESGEEEDPDEESEESEEDGDEQEDEEEGG